MTHRFSLLVQGQEGLAEDMMRKAPDFMFAMAEKAWKNQRGTGQGLDVVPKSPTWPMCFT